ncbi:MAG TPA: M1 family metallopeptidase [Bacteroidia bacterium]
MKPVLSLIISCFFLSLSAQTETEHIHYLSDPDAAERQHSVDMQHMKVEVSFQTQLGIVDGTVTHEFVTIQNNIDTLFFDAPDIKILSATLDGQNVNFTINSEGVVLRFSKKLMWDEKHTVVFKYSATPKKGIYFIGWNQPEFKGKTTIDNIRRQIWTQGQGIDNRYWIPMYDCMNDKFTTETVVTMANPYKVLSNGAKLSMKDNGNGTSTWHYKLSKPHAGYLLMLGIGIYEVKETKTSRGTPVQFWYYPEYKDRVEYTSIHTERMIELLEDETGIPYPWGSYSQIMVQNFLYGAMENTSATVFGDFFTTDARGFKDRNYMGVNCHELTHQWFGDLITARSGNDVWLQESFATFYPKLFFKDLEGDDHYQWSVRGEYNAALAQSEKDLFPVRHTKAGTTRLYPKGSAVLSMLRYQLGDDNFKRFIKHYLTVNGFRNVEAWDFQKALKDRLGLNYDWFFDQWIHRGGEPHFKVSYTNDGKNIKVNVDQIHKTNGHVRCFKMPVEFAVYYKNGNVDRRTIMVMDTNSQVISIPNTNGEIDFLLFDEKSKIMKKMTFEKPNSELFAQAEKAIYMIDRYDAIAAMIKIPYSEKAAFLKQRYAKETFFGIKAEIAKQLSNQATDEWYNNIVKESKAEIKNAFIAADTLVVEHQAIFAALMSDSSNVVAENALDKLMGCKDISNEAKLKYLAVLASISGQNNNIKTKWLEYAIKYQYNGKAGVKLNMETLTALSGPNYEFRTRVNAANALKRLKSFNEMVASNLIDACLTYNGRLRGPCADALKEFVKDSTNLKIFQKAIAKLTAEQKETLKSQGLPV